MFTHLPQSDPIANNNIAGDKHKSIGLNKFLKFLKNIIWLLLKEELKANKNRGLKPINMIKKYLKKTTKE